MRAIFHINDLNKWKTTFNSAFNCKSVCEARGEDAELYIVANGEAISILSAQDEELLRQRGRLLEAIEKGVHVLLCQKAMSLRNLTLPEDLTGATVVPSAALSIIELQEKGFPYIKS